MSPYAETKKGYPVITIRVVNTSEYTAYIAIRTCVPRSVTPVPGLLVFVSEPLKNENSADGEEQRRHSDSSSFLRNHILIMESVNDLV